MDDWRRLVMHFLAHVLLHRLDCGSTLYCYEGYRIRHMVSVVDYRRAREIVCEIRVDVIRTCLNWSVRNSVVSGVLEQH